MTESTIIEGIVEQARAAGWSRKQTRNHLYQLNCPAIWEKRDEIMLALGFATTDQAAASAQLAQEEAAKQSAAAQAQAKIDFEAKAEAARIARQQAEAKAAAETAAKREAALAAIQDGAVIWCDGAENTVTRVVNGYGRQAKFDNGGYRAGLKIGDFEEVFYNTQCPDQFAAECWSVLKACEFAAERGLKSCTIRNDRIGGFEASTKRGYIGAKYLWVAKKIAAEAGLDVTFERCTSEENLADRVVRAPGKCQ